MSADLELLSDWRLPESACSVDYHEVHVWRLSLESKRNKLQEMERLLDETERARANRFRFDKVRRQFTLTRGMLRMLLGRYLRRNPARLKISYSLKGKPFVNESENPFRVCFNVSHAGDWALLAFGLGREVGIDVESRQRLEDWKSIADRIFSEREKRELDSLPELLRAVAFYNGWTRKEAYLKATGDGLVDALNGIEVALSPLAPACLRAIHGDSELASKWSLCALEPAEGYTAALVVEGGGGCVQLWQCDDALISNSADGSNGPAEHP